MSRIPLIAFLIMFNAANAAGTGFSESVIDVGFQVGQKVLEASLTGDGTRHLVFAGLTEDHEQRMAIYAVAGDGETASAPVRRLSPGPNLVAYDVGRLAGRDALFFIEPGRVLRYDIDTGDFVEAVGIRSIYGQSRSGNIVPIDFIRDVNLDDRDDLIVPDTAGYRVRLQRPDGSLGDEVVLDQSSSMNVTNGIVSFQSRPLASGDMNLDGLTDLITWRGNSLLVYPQLPGYRFQGEPEVIDLGMGLLSEGELRALQGGPGSVNQSDLTEKHIYSVEDRDGDRIPDLLLESTLSRGVFDKRNEFRLHLGRKVGNDIVYRDKEDALLTSEGLQFGLVTTDIDGDGRKDLLLRQVRITFGRVIRALLSGSVPLRLHFFRMSDDGRYAEDANYVARTSVRFSVTTGQIDIPAIGVADFDDDGLQDLMLQTRSNRLSFFKGVRTVSLFADDATDMKVDLPRNGDLVTTEDVNGDGRADLVIRYNAADGSAAAQTVRLLIADG